MRFCPTAWNALFRCHKFTDLCARFTSKVISIYCAKKFVLVSVVENNRWESRHVANFTRRSVEASAEMTSKRSDRSWKDYRECSRAEMLKFRPRFSLSPPVVLISWIKLTLKNVSEKNNLKWNSIFPWASHECHLRFQSFIPEEFWSVSLFYSLFRDWFLEDFDLNCLRIPHLVSVRTLRRPEWQQIASSNQSLSFISFRESFFICLCNFNRLAMLTLDIG